MLETLAPAYEGKVKFLKIDANESPEAAGRFGITLVPQVFLFVNGTPVDQMSGAQPERRFKAMIDKHLAPA